MSCNVDAEPHCWLRSLLCGQALRRQGCVALHCEEPRSIVSVRLVYVRSVSFPLLTLSLGLFALRAFSFPQRIFTGVFFFFSPSSLSSSSFNGERTTLQAKMTTAAVAPAPTCCASHWVSACVAERRMRFEVELTFDATVKSLPLQRACGTVAGHYCARQPNAN